MTPPQAPTHAQHGNPTSLATIEARIELPSGEQVPAEVSDIDPSGIIVDIAGSGLPRIALAQEVKLRLFGPSILRELSIGVRAVRRSDRGDISTIALQALRSEDLRHLPPFHRRSGVRVAPRDGAPVVATITSLDGSVSATASAVDISRAGVRLALDLADEARLCDQIHVHVSLRLPNDETPVELVATIRGRALEGKQALCGLQFDRDRSADFARADLRVGRYVMSRQVELVLERGREREAA